MKLQNVDSYINESVVETITVKDIVNTKLAKMIIKRFGDKNMGYKLTATELETTGDLQEMMQIEKRGGNEANDVHNFLGYVMLSSNYVGWKEFSKLSACVEFVAKYPKLFKTFIVFGWG